jgi:hypothetical protein
MGGTLKIKASELPNEISIELRHHTETRVQYRKGQIFADPRRCPLALALQEVLTNIGIRYEEAAIYDFYGEIVLPNKQIFRAWHSKSVEGFVRGPENRWQGEAPLGVYRFDWSAVVKRRRRAPDFTELIGS